MSGPSVLRGRKSLRRLASAAAIVVATAVSGSAAGAAVDAWKTVAYFESPSKNIVCGYFTGGGSPAELECGVASGLVPPPTKPTDTAGCKVVDFVSNRLRLEATGKPITFCAGDVGVLAMVGQVPVLAYGAAWHRGPFTCRSTTTGVTCTNTSKRGFFLARGTWRTV